MSHNAFLRIGPFSRASSLSVKALRAYHETGLLVPAEIDPQTGYRSYSVAQLTDATIIRRLRELDMPLEAIREVLDARDPAVTGKVLSEHGARLGERLAATQRAIDEVSLALESPAVHTPIHLRAEPSRTVLAVTQMVSEEEWMPFLARAVGALKEAAAAAGAVVDGPFGALYPTLLEDDAQEVAAYLPIATAVVLPVAARSSGVTVDVLPATDVAVLVHIGDYETMADSYTTLGAWVAANADATDEPVRECYLVGPRDSDDTARFRTEILWPVHALGQPS
jgi:DNA-binding transcriptional MerR regulator/effector-binding domain-containing protein